MLHTEYQSSRPSTFWEEEFQNLSSLFLYSNFWTPWQDQSWPKGHGMNKLGRGPQGYHMLDVKYQGSRLSSFRVEELWKFHSLFLCSTYDPQGGASFDPRGILWTNLVENHKAMPHTKYQISTPSCIREKKIKDWLLCSYVPTCDPRGQASFDPRGITWTNLVEVLKEMLYTKYHSSRPSTFRKEKFWNFLSLFQCSNLWPPGQAQF